MATYTINHVNHTIIVTKKFMKAAGIFGSVEYDELMGMRREMPDYQFEIKEIRKKDGKKTYKNLTVKAMENYIKNREGAESENLKTFNRVKELAKIQRSPYAFMKTWFLGQYKDYATYTAECIA